MLYRTLAHAGVTGSILPGGSIHFLCLADSQENGQSWAKWMIMAEMGDHGQNVITHSAHDLP
uniref:Uncharacterized protein n=1 Tax=Moniliophthora roreri TaxID=221103 RepID=A0A0W0FG15_MONRR